MAEIFDGQLGQDISRNEGQSEGNVERTRWYGISNNMR